jgi:hypothetical protein
MNKLDRIEAVAVAANTVCKRVFGDPRNCIPACFAAQNILRAERIHCRVIPCKLIDGQGNSPQVDDTFDVGWFSGHCVLVTDTAIADLTLDQTGAVAGPLIIQLSRRQIDQFANFKRITINLPNFGKLSYERTRHHRREYIAEKTWIDWLRGLVEVELAGKDTSKVTAP